MTPTGPAAIAVPVDDTGGREAPHVESPCAALKRRYDRPRWAPHRVNLDEPRPNEKTFRPRHGRLGWKTPPTSGRHTCVLNLTPHTPPRPYLVPVLAVLAPTARVVPESPIRQEQGQEERVEIRGRILEQGGDGPEEGAGDLGKVMEVTGDAPPSRAKEERRAGLPASIDVVRGDVLRLLAPHHDLTFRLGRAEGVRG